jgi:type VI secretion system protein ImpL
MLDDVEHLDVDEEAYRRAEDEGRSPTDADGSEVRAITELCAEALRPSSDLAEPELRSRLRPHVRHYLRLVKSKQVEPAVLDGALVQRVREALMAVTPLRRHYAIFVTSVAEERHDASGGDTRANRNYPPLTLGDVFADRPDFLEALSSARHRGDRCWKQVEGPYTRGGRERVLQRLAEGPRLLEREHWVVPLSADERGRGPTESLMGVATAYDSAYVEQWDGWLQDVTVRPPETVAEAIELYATLTRPDWPYLRILRTLEDHLRWARASPELAPSAVPDAYRKLIAFGISPRGTSAPTPLATYISILDALHDEMQRLVDDVPHIDPRLVAEPLARAVARTQDLLGALDSRTRGILGPWLLDPLRAPPTGRCR